MSADYQKDGQIAVITLNNPPVNGLGLATRRAVVDGLNQANASRHLNMLYRAGVVGRRRDGVQVMYRLIDPNFTDLCRTVCVRIASREHLSTPETGLLKLEDDDVDREA